ncbi:zinc-binding dehydrogenase, partial [Escherichia coli]|uniref:zinc-binding dehydrogenase n=1 Tax=Escherichia coli TaxID=562 RepID=UPI00197F3BD9
ARVREITGGQGVKVVYDSVGADTFEGSLDCLRPFGLMVSFGNASGPVPPVNTGVPSGLDLDGSGELGREGRARGEDAWGYGLHPGQYGMLLLSRHPIDADAARTFRLLRWSALPGARRPHWPDGRPFHADA